MVAMENKESPKLKFHPDGSFKIMQITDIQDGVKLSADTMNFIERALDEAKPDLVVFTGDQIKGYSSSLKGNKAQENVKFVIDKIIEPLAKRSIPFAVAFGNHDLQCKIPTEMQLEFYQSYPQCVSYDTPNVPGVANHIVPILGSDGKNVVFNLYIFDSHGSKGTGYDTIHKEQIDWYRNEREKLREENGKYVPSFVFQHIPFEEMYFAFDEVKRNTKGSLPAYRKRKGKSYKLKSDYENDESFFGELPAVPDVNMGQFEAIKEKGDVIGAFFGHDHKNCFIAKHEGVDMGYTPGVGFNVYGPSYNRGVRIFELNEKEPLKYKTKMLFYKDIIGKKVEKRLLHYLIDKTPSSVDVAIAQISKALLAIAAIIAVVIILIEII
jgi:hypothetical protein